MRACRQWRRLDVGRLSVQSGTGRFTTGGESRSLSREKTNDGFRTRETEPCHRCRSRAGCGIRWCDERLMDRLLGDLQRLAGRRPLFGSYPAQPNPQIGSRPQTGSATVFCRPISACRGVASSTLRQAARPRRSGEIGDASRRNTLIISERRRRDLWTRKLWARDEIPGI